MFPAVRDQVLRFREVNTNLIAQLFSLGFRRRYVGYERAARRGGASAWTLAQRVEYCLDSIFNFTDLPVRFLLAAGSLGSALAAIAAVVVLAAKLRGNVQVPGYTPIVLAILFFGGLITLGLGVLGQYQWLTLQNARGRPNYVIARSERYAGTIEPREDVEPARVTETTP